MTKTDRCEREFMSVCFRYNGELLIYSYLFCDFLGESFAFSDYSCIFATDMSSLRQ